MSPWAEDFNIIQISMSILSMCGQGHRTVIREHGHVPHAKSSDKGYKVALKVMYPSIVVISFDTEGNIREWKSGHFLIEAGSNNFRRGLVCTTAKGGEY